MHAHNHAQTIILALKHECTHTHTHTHTCVRIRMRTQESEWDYGLHIQLDANLLHQDGLDLVIVFLLSGSF